MPDVQQNDPQHLSGVRVLDGLGQREHVVDAIAAVGHDISACHHADELDFLRVFHSLTVPLFIFEWVARDTRHPCADIKVLF